MSQRLILEATGFGVRAALVENDGLVEIRDADEAGAPGGGQVTDTLLLGRVTAIDSRLNAAFVDLGAGEPGFLAAKDARFAAGTADRLPAAKLLREGDRLIVQGLREAESGGGGAVVAGDTGGGKGPRLTTDLKLFGFHLIWRPHGHLGEPPGPARGAERQALQARGAALFPDGSVTLRKLAAGAGDEALLAERARLEERWTKLQAGIANRAKPGRLSGDEHPVERLLRGLVGPGLATIEVADEALATRVAGLLAGPLAPHGIELVRLEAHRSAFEQTEVSDALDLALGRVVPLPGGGRLIIEATAAFTAVDVDGEGRAAIDVDLAAARALARLLRLRNLGGTIVVDFVDLSTKGQRMRLEEALKRAFRDDPLPVDIYPMSPLGIVQISRARRGRSLDALLQGGCPVCDGSGRIASLRARAEALIRELGAVRPSASRVRAAPDLARYLDAEAAPGFARAAAGAVVTPDPALAPGSFLLER